MGVAYSHRRISESPVSGPEAAAAGKGALPLPVPLRGSGLLVSLQLPSSPAGNALLSLLRRSAYFSHVEVGGGKAVGVQM